VSQRYSANLDLTVASALPQPAIEYYRILERIPYLHHFSLSHSASSSEQDDGPDVLRWLDRMLIRLVWGHWLRSWCEINNESVMFLPTVSEVWGVSQG